MKIGFAQEIITPPLGVGLQGYFNKRPNRGMYDDLYVKVIVFEVSGKRFGFMTFDLASLKKYSFDELEKRIVAKYGKELHDGLVISTTHTHTASMFPVDLAEADEVTLYSFNQTMDAAMRALDRALMNLYPSEIAVGSVYNNPFGFVRRYWMKNGTIVTNPGWGNPDIDKPESDFDRTIGIMAIKQDGRLAALVCNIANHGDTIGGDLVSADWYGRFAQEIQHALKTSLPVIVLDDASGDINHFDFHQKINQSSYAEATRIGRGYAAIVLDALDNLEPVEEAEVRIINGTVTIPHRKLTVAEYEEAKHTLATVPDIKKEGTLESQDLANKVPAALRYFANHAIDCFENSIPSHDGRITVIAIGDKLAFATLPGEPFNGIARAIREKSPYKYTFVVELAQSESGYVPLKECFERGGYEVQPRKNTVSPEAAGELIKAVTALLEQR